MNNKNLLGKTFILAYPNHPDGYYKTEVIITAVAEDGTVRVEYAESGVLCMCPGPKLPVWRADWKTTVTLIRRAALLGETFYVPQYMADISGPVYCSI